MALTLEDAWQLARDYVSGLGEDIVLDEEPACAGDWGWVFCYQSRAYLRSGDISDMLLGNAPLLVDRHGERVWVLGTSQSIEAYVDAFLTHGDPLGTRDLSPKVALGRWREGAQRIPAVKAIRAHSELGLKDAKAAVDGCLAGQDRIVACASTDDARTLAEDLVNLGFEARQLSELPWPVIRLA